MREPYVIIPTICTNGYIYDLLNSLRSQGGYEKIIIIDNNKEKDALLQSYTEFTEHDIEVTWRPNMGIYEMWNLGIALAAADGAYSVAVLNDDIIIGPSFLTELTAPLEDEKIWFVSANWDQRHFEEKYKYFPGTRKDGGLCGFAFAMPIHAILYQWLEFEERYNIWYGDDDILHQIDAKGGNAVMARDAHVDHIGGGSQSFGDRCRLVNEENAKDTEIYLEKWYTK